MSQTLSTILFVLGISMVFVPFILKKLSIKLRIDNYCIIIPIVSGILGWNSYSVIIVHENHEIEKLYYSCFLPAAEIDLNNGYIVSVKTTNYNSIVNNTSKSLYIDQIKYGSSYDQNLSYEENISRENRYVNRNIKPFGMINCEDFMVEYYFTVPPSAINIKTRNNGQATKGVDRYWIHD